MKTGKYGDYGGIFVPETLMNPLIELQKKYLFYINDENFIIELNNLLKEYANRPSNLYYAKRMSEDLETRIYLKREDLNHTGSHKINNVLGQTLLAKKMGKKKVVAETGAGQHGVATATAAALNNLDCIIFMGSEDMKRQSMNVFRIKLLGAKVIEAKSGTGTLKDATNEAFKYWAKTCEDTFYVLGSVVGPHPYPEMVRNFQSVIGKETKRQILEKEGRLPNSIVACVGGGSNAMGIFHSFINDKEVKLIGCEAAGSGIDTKKHAATISKGSKGVFHGMKSLFIQNDEGQIEPVYSISAGLDYPGIGPEHSYLNEIKRAQYYAITDKEAIEALLYLSRKEGIIPALESAHAVAYVIKKAKDMKPDDIVIINLSGRGDKDVTTIHNYLKEK